jgi:hypothetical protein
LRSIISIRNLKKGSFLGSDPTFTRLRNPERCHFPFTDAGEDFGVEVGQMQLIFVQSLTPNPTQHDPHGPDDPFITINYHHLNISGHDGMDEQDIGWRNGWAGEDFGVEVGQMQLVFVQS